MSLRVVGVDFDNTIVGYDELLARIGAEEGWLGAEAPLSKRAIRERVRALPQGELKWRRLQALAYGARIGEARLLDGVREFFAGCEARDIPVHVVSHKTVQAAADPGGVDLRAAARAWLRANGLLHDGRVHFEDDRAGKLRRIAELGCTHFVDDLEETFLDPAFPRGVEQILFRPDGEPSGAAGTRVCRTWAEIAEHVLGAA